MPSIHLPFHPQVPRSSSLTSPRSTRLYTAHPSIQHPATTPTNHPQRGALTERNDRSFPDYTTTANQPISKCLPPEFFARLLSTPSVLPPSSSSASGLSQSPLTTLPAPTPLLQPTPFRLPSPTAPPTPRSAPTVTTPSSLVPSARPSAPTPVLAAMPVLLLARLLPPPVSTSTAMISRPAFTVSP
ncbi:uncharacterized protein QC763_502590 [Podospora pseudopauciseta]|uniref:Uncharacterized protein n=1 Tax=Podospora pseudopauciseta TaxID=2093780 RepID=A0ABR0H6Y1_9PEZI|nr:hypothetical protein QC763_502590 [Podospora pseudopauciseta]